MCRRIKLEHFCAFCCDGTICKPCKSTCFFGKVGNCVWQHLPVYNNCYQSIMPYEFPNFVSHHNHKCVVESNYNTVGRFVAMEPCKSTCFFGKVGKCVWQHFPVCDNLIWYYTIFLYIVYITRGGILGASLGRDQLCDDWQGQHI